MANFFQTLETVLKKDKRFTSKPETDQETGTLLRNKVYESALNMDTALIKLLLSNKDTKERFFTDIDGVLVFDKIAFGWVVNNHQFLPDSYTRFKNRIGLADADGDLISASNDVVLTFPYKDCVLEGGQSKEDQKREEIFYNATLAPDEVDRLLYPKVLTGAKRYTAKGVEENITFKDDDNLIIKGNNLLAISSLLKRYEGKVKCIYIDPPYNTGGDSFGYNDRFNHSTWLTFMKNRLDIAKRLLNNNGVIFIHCDNNEQAHLKVLCDEIFNRENFIETITVVNNPRGRDYSGIANMHEFILVYGKTLDYSLYNINDEEKQFPYQDEISGFETRELRNRNTAFHKGNRPNLCYPFYINPKNVDKNGFLEISLGQKKGYIELFPAKSQGIQTVWRWGKEKSLENLNINIVGKPMQNGSYMIVEKYRKKDRMARSVWFDKKVNSERGTLHLKELFGDKVFSHPKPEDTLSRIIEIASNEGDIILDFHLGSGTTATVAHKMGRRYIGIEQMDYIESVTVERLKKVIEGEQGGISEDVNWQCGGSFVYCELAKCNQNFVDKAIAAKTDKEVIALLDQVLQTGFTSYKVFPKDMSEAAEDFADLSLEDKKRFIIELLDKNMLYVNLCDINDKDYAISKADKAFTNSFYNIGVNNEK